MQRLDKGENPHPKAQPKIETITIQDLYRQYISGKKTPLAASSIKLLRGLYRLGIALHPGVITHNPVEAVREVRGREWLPRNRRMTFIEPKDLPAWHKGVSDYNNPKGRDYMLLLYTGLRKMEAARLKWSDTDFKAKTFTFIPEKKRGEKPEDDRVGLPGMNVHR